MIGSVLLLGRGLYYVHRYYYALSPATNVKIEHILKIFSKKDVQSNDGFSNGDAGT